MTDLSLYRKLAGTYGVGSSEENSINQFVKQSNKIYDNTLSLYELLSPSNRGDDVDVVFADGTEVRTRAVFNYNSRHSKATMESNQERCFLAMGDGLYGNYVNKVDSNEKFIVEMNDRNRFDYDDVFVRKCNVQYKFYDEYGVLHSYDGYAAKGTTNISLDQDKTMALVDGKLLGLLQKNEHTEFILEGQEFIFNKSKYRISYLNDFQYDGLLILDFERVLISNSDSLELGIANYEDRPIFNLTILNDDSEFVIGDTIQINHSIIDKDGQQVYKDVVYTSSDESVMTVDSNGIVTALTDGIATIKVSMAKNDNVFDESTLLVTATPSSNIYIDVSNSTTEITKTFTETYVWNKYDNGVILTSNFTFEIDPSSTASSNDYDFVIINGNSYSITCINEGKKLVINILEDDGLSKQITYDLVGFW